VTLKNQRVEKALANLNKSWKAKKVEVPTFTYLPRLQNHKFILSIFLEPNSRLSALVHRVFHVQILIFLRLPLPITSLEVRLTETLTLFSGKKKGLPTVHAHLFRVEKVPVLMLPPQK
jgi:hypothetical protein